MALGKVQLWEKTSSPMLEPVVISKGARVLPKWCCSRGEGMLGKAGQPNLLGAVG